jgi:hypothetical protein
VHLAQECRARSSVVQYRIFCGVDAFPLASDDHANYGGYKILSTGYFFSELLALSRYELMVHFF